MTPWTRKQTIDALNALGFRPRKNWGQNFLFDRQLLKAFVEDTGLPAGARVLEIGCGAGTLTHELIEHGCEVLGVEVDTRLCGLLRERFSGQSLRLLEGDALASKNALSSDLEAELAAGGDYWLVANLPYAVATPIVQLLLGRTAAPALLGIGVLVQKEVADKWSAPVGTKDYGPATAALALFGEGAIARTVSAALFWPPPRVASAFFVWRPRCTLPGVLPRVRGVWRTLFQRRRKMLRALIGDRLPAADSWWAEHGIDPTQRPESLTPAQLTTLAEELLARGWTS